MTKQAIDEFLQEATTGQLRELASHPNSHYVSNVACGDENGKVVAGFPCSLFHNGRVRRVTRDQFMLLRSTGSKIVSAKAKKVLMRRLLIPIPDPTSLMNYPTSLLKRRQPR
jgi:hypothetical protein